MESPKKKSTVPYLEELFHWAAHVFSDTSRGGAKNNFRPISGLKTLAETLSVSSQPIHSQGESSPFLQLPLMEWTVPSRRAQRESFDWWSCCAYEYVRIASSVFHVLLWEPFLSGKVPLGDKRDTVLRLNSFEGASVWIRDMVAVKAVRESSSAGEAFFIRRPDSDANFQTYRAFQSHRAAPRDSLDYFVRRFAGDPVTEVNRKFNSEFTQHYALPAHGNSLHTSLGRTGFWREFAPRFFGIAGLPSLSNSKMDSLFRQSDYSAYCAEAFRWMTSDFPGVDPRVLARVRQRRDIQRRAYQAFLIRHCLSSEQTVERINDYLENLHFLLEQLAAGTSMPTLTTGLRLADEYYDQKLKKVFLKEGTRGILIDGSRKSWLQTNREMALQHFSSRLSFRRSPAEAVALLKDLSHTRMNQKKGPTLLSRNPALRDLWSFPLGEIDPRHGRFKEILPQVARKK